MLKCTKCGNEEKFLQSARVTEEWLCDNMGNLVEVLESYDSEPSNDFQCFECASWNVVNIDNSINTEEVA